jgi:hypothetical protein
MSDQKKMSDQKNRSAMISRHLGVSAPFSPAASDLNDQLQILLAEVGDLDRAEQTRLLSALMVQISGKMAELCN